MDEFKKLIREVPDFPKPGINFYDITTLLNHRPGFCRLIDYLTLQTRPIQADFVLGIEARGFIFAPALAYNLNAGFHSDPQAGETSRGNRSGELRSGIRYGHA